MGQKTPVSPRILSSGWGRIEIEGIGAGKDYKLWPGGGRPWDWREHGTGHVAGIQNEDVAELLEHGCTAIVLSRGRFSRLKVAEALVDSLRSKGLRVEVASTKSAIALYNELARQGVAVGGLFHTTC